MTTTSASPISRRAVLGMLGCLSKCHIVVSLMMLVLAGLADYVSHRMNTLRLHGLVEFCAFYLLLMGVIGIFGSASHRRGLIITFLAMSIHAVVMIAPMAIIYSSFDIHFYKKECWGACDWHLLSASLPKNSRCQILCGDEIEENRRRTMKRLGTDYRLDAGLISLASVEFLLSLATAALCIKQVFGAEQTPSGNGALAEVVSKAQKSKPSAQEATIELQPLEDPSHTRGIRAERLGTNRRALRL